MRDATRVLALVLGAIVGLLTVLTVLLAVGGELTGLLVQESPYANYNITLSESGLEHFVDAPAVVSEIFVDADYKAGKSYLLYLKTDEGTHLLLSGDGDGFDCVGCFKTYRGVYAITAEHDGGKLVVNELAFK